MKVAGILICTVITAWSSIGFSKPKRSLPYDPSKGTLFENPSQLKGREGLNTPTWVCGSLRSSRISLKCEDLGINELEGPKAELQISLYTGGFHHSYGLRHGIATSECKLERRQIIRLLRGASTFCILGQFVGIEKRNANVSATEIGWVFFEFQTPKGVACDFCDSSPYGWR